MAQDIREMLRNQDSGSTEKLNKGHEKRFEARLNKELTQKRSYSSYYFLSIAAVLVVALGIGLFFFNNPAPVTNDTEIVDTPAQETSEEELLNEKQFQLSDVSPEFKQIENYYLASINLELAKLEINNDNKALIDAFMLQLEELDKEYQRLNAELTENPNEQTVEAMIANLQLRLELLLKLKNKLKEIKNSKKNTSYENLQA